MKLLSKGCPNKEILEKLYMSEGTIRNIIYYSKEKYEDDGGYV